MNARAHWLLALLAALPLAAFAIDDGGEEIAPDAALYRIELVIVANQNPAEEASEQWLPPRELPLPPNLRLLHDPASAALPADGSSPAATAATALPADSLPVIAQQDDFAQLAARLQRNRRYRVLFSSAWQQSLPPGVTPVAVVIRGGEAYGEHHELEGTLQLWRERYLHAHARLWLSRFASEALPDAGTPAVEWPPLPTLPSVPASTDDAATDDAAATAGNADAGMAMDGTAAPGSGLVEDGWPDAEPWAPQLERIVLLDHKRRLRSGELQYFDHPLFGLILRITPLDSSKTAPTVR